MQAIKINFWIRYLFPLFLALFLGAWIYILGQFREPPSFKWYGLFWFVGSIFLLWESGWWVTRILNKYFPWRKGTFKRLSIQLLITNLIGILLFLFFYILLNWYETSIRGSFNNLTLLHVAAAVTQAFFIIQIVNSVQIGYQLLQTWQEVQLESDALKKNYAITRLENLRNQINPSYLDDNFRNLENIIRDTPEKVSAYLQELSENYQNRQDHLASSITQVQQTLKTKDNNTYEAAVDNGTSSQLYKSRFLVRSGARFYLIPIDEVAAIYKDDLILLFTKDSKKYVLDGSLEEHYGQLPTKKFFRINRQCIIQAQYLDEMRMEGSQMIITLSVPFPKTLAVSQRNVAAFKRWLKEE